MADGDVVAGGEFNAAGGSPAANIARWTDSGGGAWSPLGTGVSHLVRSIGELPAGDLVVGGSFTFAGGTPVKYIARWDGDAWSSMNSGMSHDVYPIITLPNSDLVVGGVFAEAGGQIVNRIVRWDGAGGGTWHKLGQGLMGTYVSALTSLPTGEVIAGGNFISAGGISAKYIARYGCRCAADCDRSSQLNIDDFICFQTLYGSATTRPIATPTARSRSTTLSASRPPSQPAAESPR